ncbi:MAG: hypothetical protein U0930_10250 [Pirellulales bacterium]
MKFQNRIQKAKRRLLLGALLLTGSIVNSDSSYAQEKAAAPKLDLVQANTDEQPRLTPMTRAAMKQYLEDLKYRKLRIPLPELSDAEKKRALEDPRAGGYESRLRSNYLTDATNAYLTFGGSPARGFPNNPNRPNQPTESKLTLDYGFKVRMFWIAARANNCQYCLGHQESKLLAEGMTEDAIASLDSDWSQFPDKERVAFALAKKLTSQPYTVTDKDIDDCRHFYSDLQIIEMIGSVAGNNAINRWKEGAGIPQSSNGGNFGASRGTAPSTSSEEHSYLTPTSEKFAKAVSKVAVAAAPVKEGADSVPTQYERPTLEVGEALTAKLKMAETRKPRLPLADVATTREVMGDIVGSDNPPAWMRLLAHFPVAGKRLADAMVANKKSDQLDEKLQSMIDWVVARQDGAWYLTGLAKRDMEKLGGDAELMKTLDGDLSKPSSKLSERERILLILCKNVAASPIILTDKQVAEAVDVAGARAVTQAINYTCYRASLDRITEAAGLALQN